MAQFIFWRSVRIIPVVLVVVTLIFGMFRLVPGDPARTIAGPQASPDSVEQVRKELGLDQPVYMQYFTYIAGLAKGDFGYSGVFRGDAFDVIVPRLPGTLALLLSAMGLTILIGIPAGVISGVYRGTFLDFIVSLFVVSMLSIPNFWLGLMMITFFSIQKGWLPSFGFDDWTSLIMPTLAVSARLIAVVARMTRSSMLETMQKDYVRTARAKGLADRVVVYKHGLRNALVPTITTLGLQAGYLLGGSIVIERLFSWPGIGELMINSVGMRDFNVVQGITLVFATGFLLMNLLVDLVYAWVNPRIRYQ